MHLLEENLLDIYNTPHLFYVEPSATPLLLRTSPMCTYPHLLLHRPTPTELLLRTTTIYLL